MSPTRENQPPFGRKDLFITASQNGRPAFGRKKSKSRKNSDLNILGEIFGISQPATPGKMSHRPRRLNSTKDADPDVLTNEDSETCFEGNAPGVEQPPPTAPGANTLRQKSKRQHQNANGKASQRPYIVREHVSRPPTPFLSHARHSTTHQLQHEDSLFNISVTPALHPSLGKPIPPFTAPTNGLPLGPVPTASQLPFIAESRPRNISAAPLQKGPIQYPAHTRSAASSVQQLFRDDEAFEESTDDLKSILEHQAEDEVEEDLAHAESFTSDEDTSSQCYSPNEGYEYIDDSGDEDSEPSGSAAQSRPYQDSGRERRADGAMHQANRLFLRGTRAAGVSLASQHRGHNLQLLNKSSDDFYPPCSSSLVAHMGHSSESFGINMDRLRERLGGRFHRRSASSRMD
ncbi:uncharacterized protein B0I36DRAFT_386748 [Microdochium trichocladiopsis]|uniref:Uncharacterized protein n=1 Tax=Microdochium trichocladiopsis TaxID=1682393 RepID=A0A9P8Y3I2_9PEZI|nr:uncharacterized protein B0I36DRAFT_386748 [Microdochium trichocladiopsis]KAH7026498.1 hypothetical protein B0I36DRAFT_386748 [Microdochium trichocladiopsis]